MKNYFINPELKRSSITLLILMSIFLGITSFSLKIHHDNLKVSYIKTLGAVAARVVEKEPKLEKEILPLIVEEISRDEEIKGVKLLKQYGVTMELESSLFPYIREVTTKNWHSMLFIFSGITVIFFILNYVQYIFFYKRIRRITKAAKKVVEGEYDISISEDREGDFSKLAISFNSMREIIRNNLQELKREKQFLVDLLSDISHQLKTPLSSMILYNDIMLNKELSLEQRTTFLVNNQSQLHRMEWLIKSMLKLAKVDAKAVNFHKEKFSLNETVYEAIEALESMAVEKGVNVSFNESEEVVLNHDRLWMQEAFINIIKNGIEHNKCGGKINILLFENPIYIRGVIEDNGEGITQEDLPNIFKRFYRAKTSLKSTSVGIGLALSKSIVEAHNGMIEVESKLGKYTKFTITFLKY